MKELDEELWKLAIPAKTKHNEVAPTQHELAPVFEEANVAIDHNLLVMELMKILASHHGLVCLEHEKPFAGVNGSGKHDNWSLAADGTNLLDPGDTPEENLQFLVFLSCIIATVDEYQDMLRVSVASAGNDHRLGAHEAPPAIISIFLGDQLNAVVQAIINNAHYESHGKESMDLGVPEQGHHRPQPHLALRLHGQQVRVPRCRLQPEPLRPQHGPQHRRGQDAQGVRRRHGGLREL